MLTVLLSGGAANPHREATWSMNSVFSSAEGISDLLLVLYTQYSFNVLEPSAAVDGSGAFWTRLHVTYLPCHPGFSARTHLYSRTVEFIVINVCGLNAHIVFFSLIFFLSIRYMQRKHQKRKQENSFHNVVSPKCNSIYNKFHFHIGGFKRTVFHFDVTESITFIKFKGR